jgi:hypothetical protein
MPSRHLGSTLAGRREGGVSSDEMDDHALVNERDDQST